VHTSRPRYPIELLCPDSWTEVAAMPNPINVGDTRLSKSNVAIMIRFYRTSKRSDFKKSLDKGKPLVTHLDGVVNLISRRWIKTSVAVLP